MSTDVKGPRVLFIGNDWEGSNARSLFKAFAALGCQTKVVDTSHLSEVGRFSPDRVRMKLGLPTGARHRSSLTGYISELISKWSPDILLGFKVTRLPMAEILDGTSAVTVHYHPDDSTNPDNGSRSYYADEPHWDLHVTTKSFNVEELLKRGAKDVLFVRCAYDPDWHMRLATDHHFSAGFIGNFRRERSQLLTHLAREYGPDLVVAGERWNKAPELSRHASLMGPCYGASFSRFVSTVKSNLVLLNHENRDLHTCRSYEVPAAGGLFIGERTQEHQEMLTEGEEALFFDSADELFETLDWVRKNELESSKIANAGWLRTISQPNAYVDRAAEILRKVETRGVSR